jgi:predicted O-methyltransferase YrrM
MNKLRLNTKLLFFRFPIASLLFYFGDKLSLQKKLLRLAFKWSNFENQNLANFNQYWQEIITKNYVPFIESSNKLAGNALQSTFGKWIYIVVRAKKPNIMIETGVAQGYSSWVILNAMKKNQMGHLYSIDLPSNDTNNDYNFNQSEIGHVVPEELLSNWTLIIGDVKVELPKLQEKLPKIDLFFHDSDHSYEHMNYEFEEAKKMLLDNGLILSDDIHKNKAFEEFIVKNCLKHCIFTKGGMCFK